MLHRDGSGGSEIRINALHISVLPDDGGESDDDEHASLSKKRRGAAKS